MSAYKRIVLFVCNTNSSRSQMAEGYLNLFAPNEFIVKSAGFQPGKLSPLAVKVMMEDGVDISGSTVNGINYFTNNLFIHFIIILSETGKLDASFGVSNESIQMKWVLENPSDFTGTEEEKIVRMRILRDKIKLKVKEFIDYEKAGSYTFKIL